MSQQKTEGGDQIEPDPSGEDGPEASQEEIDRLRFKIAYIGQNCPEEWRELRV